MTSPGGLYNGLTYEEVMNGHSKIRNKGIANIFSQMGLVEAWGSGIKKILNAAEEYGLSKPRFQEFDNMFRVELFRSSFPMTNEKENIGETSEKHRRSIGETSEVAWRTDLNDTQQKIIKLLSEDHQLSAVKLAEKIGVASRNIENNIKKCLDRKTPKDGKEENIRVRVTPEQKQRLVEYAERHYQSMSGVVCQALDLLYAREEQQNNKE